MDDLDTGGGTSGRPARSDKESGSGLWFRTQPDAGDDAGCCKLQNRRHRNIKWNSNWMKSPPSPLLFAHPHCCSSALSCSGAQLQLPLCGPGCAIEPKPEPRPTSKGKRRKHDFYVTRTLFLQSLLAGATLQLRRWRSPVGSQPQPQRVAKIFTITTWDRARLQRRSDRWRRGANSDMS